VRAAEFFDGWQALGMALMKIGRFPEAIEARNRVTKLRPNDQIGWTSLSLFYTRNGDTEEAAGTIAKILGWAGKVERGVAHASPRVGFGVSPKQSFPVKQRDVE
jgi:predicted Zn-dependent protease